MSMNKKTIILAALAVIAMMNIAAFILMGLDKHRARQGKWRVPEKDAVFGDGVLWRAGRRAGHEGVSPQDPALVLQGVLPPAVDRPGHFAGGWGVPVDAMRQMTESGFAGGYKDEEVCDADHYAGCI